jgi:hypothetical protein
VPGGHFNSPPNDLDEGQIMTGKFSVVNKIQSQMNQQLESANIIIPNVHMKKFTEIVAEAVGGGWKMA